MLEIECRNHAELDAWIKRLEKAATAHRAALEHVAPEVGARMRASDDAFVPQLWVEATDAGLEVTAGTPARAPNGLEIPSETEALLAEAIEREFE